ncbi:MAG: protein TolR [Ferrovum myxofaciens]|uniref:protein TolR n=1 Tax=Ferrovum myxofaciens TaxID=416213 RepID=UPI0023578268|nr:protein TolR [Ferrovum myxofaciens]QKE41571.1 MAG: protein TolR [Ferrovum myxofaciens]
MARKPRRMMSQINVVPYIDVMLVLLVIFMVTAPMINPGQVDLPSVGQNLAQSQDPVQVILHLDGHLTVLDTHQGSEEQSVTRDGLVDRMGALHRSEPDRPVVIAADRAVRYEEVLQVMDLLKKAKIKRIGLLARGRSG